MAAVNGIQSAPPSPGGFQVISGGGAQKNNEPQNPGLAVDTYSGGNEAWRNRATSFAGQTDCRCGNCPACAAQAYASQGQRLVGEEKADAAEPSTVLKQDGSGQEEGVGAASEPNGVAGEVLSQQEQAQLAELKKIDRTVRAHEQAHLAAAGSIVRRGVSLSYEKGADGRRYAVGGEVSIDTSQEADPADTVTKMRTVRAAALAPADPSPQDRKVAAAAMVTMNTAMAELRLERSPSENGENVVAQAAARMAGDDTGGKMASEEAPGEPGVAKTE